MPKLQDKGLGWIFHRYSRSEIEFSYRIFKVHANDDTSAVSFKTNRKGGYLAKSENSIAESSFLDRVFDETSITAYHNSLQEFELKCGVSADIERAKSKISEASILRMLEGIPEDIFERDHKVLLTAFAGTRFFDYIVNRKL
ncbi:hypothetical protein [Pseudotabrizicola sp.]|uniref:hypothetical protein n=1 Tax=Pseudotabrizicola sp. TaxID=2939647 RepID=UPI0027183E12|nr:hypothetical protein [Pseudotabrizicola sp.]MDO8884956.1 hypothetical protein [Pseudotabrizicola sp.]